MPTTLRYGRGVEQGVAASELKAIPDRVVELAAFYVCSLLPGFFESMIVKSVITTNVVMKSESSNTSINYWYAKNYDPLQDIRLIVKNYKQLGS